MRHEPFIFRYAASSNASNLVTLSAPKLLPGTRLRVRWVGLDNQTTETLATRFGITDILGFHQVWTNFNVVTLAGYGLLSDFWVLEGEQLTCTVKGSAQIGPVFFSASGLLYIADPDAGGPPLAPMPPPQAR